MSTTEKHLFIFGNGYTAGFIAEAAETSGFKVTISSRTPENAGENCIHQFGKPLPKGITHIISTVPPANGGDPVLGMYPNLSSAGYAFIGYLSSTGVYGDTGGEEVTEESPLNANAPRTTARKEAEAQWLALDAVIHVFRLSGIYGPGRNMLKRVKEGNVNMLEQSNRPVNRIHVADICQVVLAAMAAPCPQTEAFNLADDTPAPTKEVIQYAADLLGLTVTQSGHTSSHLADGSRIVNCDKVKATFGIKWLYPSFKDGLRAIANA